MGVFAEISGTVCCLLLLAYMCGSSFASKCLFLSYQVAPNAYTKGINDLYFVILWIVIFVFLRAALMRYVFSPVAVAYHVSSTGKRQRLEEQGFMFTYYSIFWVYGMVLMYNSPYWFNTKYYWIDYPHIPITGAMKSYYLMQLGFYFQQIYVLHVEKRRKDHFPMLLHHIITIALIGSSYCGNFTRVGNAVLCTMDVADILLSLAKILKYLNFTTLCDYLFAAFAISWPITRQFFLSAIVWSIAAELPLYIEMKWDPANGKYMNSLMHKVYLTLFAALNIIMVYWFIMILKVLWKVIQGRKPEDTRSDDEEEGQAPRKQK
ncbi:longevity assurance proteins LAG1/LAC1 [Radiomyces spectabilis]|uniref:longevity assurance proteins LAG1/LAC1 n=1 Tax=Radiomyces spectabilis TaxID=64574 RepID=UPI00221FD6FA|nr:longevity assurance proteins LAG1/LAC1 [Radiomyces spectabilis]KAI8384935.1 longevity assurance proteins LAG1/LAC1 [Radiomyces spectabilis]